jgi:hypothetical protein
MNRKKSHSNTTGFKGVSYVHDCHRKKPYLAQIKVNKINKNLGYFSTPKEAAAAYDQAAIKYFGEFARTNAQIEREKNL